MALILVHEVSMLMTVAWLFDVMCQYVEVFVVAAAVDGDGVHPLTQQVH